jgi:hypothetical protein
MHILHYWWLDTEPYLTLLAEYIYMPREWKFRFKDAH